MPKVSVIIPVYGVEKYIERCARSLFEQTLDDIEFVFVNDCTCDKSVEVLQHVLSDYPHRRNQTRILHHDINRGLPEARRTGIEAAQGEYIAHCDSDDWVERDIYQLMYERAKTNNLDLIICDYYCSDGVEKKPVSEHVPKDPQQAFSFLLRKEIHSVVWNKMAKKSLYKDNTIMYPVANNMEDLVFSSQLCFYSNHIGKIEKPLYYYYINPDAMTKVPSKEGQINRLFQSVKNIKVIEHFLKEKNILEKYQFQIDMLKFSEKRILFPYISDNDVFRLWNSLFEEIKFRIILNPFVPTRDKVIYIVAKMGLYKQLKPIFTKAK